MAMASYRSMWPLGADPAWIKEYERKQAEQYRQGGRVGPPYARVGYVNGVPTAPAVQAAAASAATGGTAFSGTPQYYGFTDFDALQKQIYEKGMANVTDYWAGKDQMSSSMYAQAAATTAAEAQRQRYGVELSENARRTTWEQNRAIQDWRERESAAQRNLAYQQQTRQLALQRRQMRVEQERAWNQAVGSMDAQDAWNLIEAGIMQAPGESTEDFWTTGQGKGFWTPRG
jgi:hypothetical protein